MKQFAPYLILLSCLTACSKKDTAPTVDFGPNGGISERDVHNYSVGANDPTDWTVDNTWNEKELALFGALPIALNSVSSGLFDVGALRSLYPNPLRGATTAIFTFPKPLGVEAQLVTVDKHYTIVDSFTFGATHTIFRTLLSLPSNKYSVGQTYRLYYIFYSGSTLHAKGHGDFKVILQ